MTHLSHKIKLYLGREVDFQRDVILFDDSDGKGAYIQQWNVAEAQPTDEQLNALDVQAATLESNNQVDSTRRKEYGSWNNQLDEIYHDIDAWKIRLKGIKDANPKK
jgi:hypothetical protein